MADAKLPRTRRVWFTVDRDGVIADWVPYVTKRGAAANAKRLSNFYIGRRPFRARKFEACK
jgi:hypothetical protein